MTNEQRENKRRAGSLGGRATVARYGPDYMREIGKRGAATLWARYALLPWQVAAWAIVDRETNQVKSIRR